MQTSMSFQLPTNMDKAAFLAWVQSQERQRYELVCGSVVEAPPNTLGHALITASVATALESRLDPKQWHVLFSFGLDTGPCTIRDPDIIVDTGGHLQDLTASAPAILAEVLSPSSATIDLGDKPAEYLRVSSLCAYFVLSQDEPKVWAWVRGDCGFDAAPRVITSKDGIVRIPALSLELPLAEIYKDFPAPETT